MLKVHLHTLVEEVLYNPEWYISKRIWNSEVKIL